MWGRAAMTHGSTSGLRQPQPPRSGVLQEPCQAMERGGSDSECESLPSEHQVRINTLPASRAVHSAFSQEHRPLVLTARERWADVQDNDDDDDPVHVIWGGVDRRSESNESSGQTDPSERRNALNPQAQEQLRQYQTAAQDNRVFDPGSDGTSSYETSSSSTPILQPTPGQMLSQEKMMHLDNSDTSTTSSPEEWQGQGHGFAGNAQTFNPLKKDELIQLMQKVGTGTVANQQVFAALSEEDLEGIKPYVPLNEDGNFTSVGSVLHPMSCKPCLFVHSNLGCQNGLRCTFCHFTHTRKHPSRPCKGKRDRYRKLIHRMEQEQEHAQIEDGQGQFGIGASA